ncbi:MAG: hypothetical protein ACYSUN_12325 [Planctomycetota bacterium]
MQDVKIYDNGGATFDRYTVIIDGVVYGMSEDATSPGGFNQYVGTVSETDIIIQMDMDMNKSELICTDIYDESIELPKGLKRAVFQRMAREMELPCFGIVVTLLPDMTEKGKYGGSIVSNLKEEDFKISDEDDNRLRDEYGAAIDGLESLILGHACAGIDITSPAYIEGIETAESAIGNNFS